MLKLFILYAYEDDDIGIEDDISGSCGCKDHDDNENGNDYDDADGGNDDNNDNNDNGDDVNDKSSSVN